MICDLGHCLYHETFCWFSGPPDNSLSSPVSFCVSFSQSWFQSLVTRDSGKLGDQIVSSVDHTCELAPPVQLVWKCLVGWCLIHLLFFYSTYHSAGWLTSVMIGVHAYLFL